MTRGVVRLDDPAAQRVEEFGAKAAGLARARQAELPVLDGYAVAVTESLDAMAAGRAAMAERGSGAARRAVAAAPIDPDLTDHLTSIVDGLGGEVIVRSSSPLEVDPRWSGAFSSMGEVGPDDVAVALRSCWASAFALDPLARLVALDLDISVLTIGLVVQPQLRPVAGGLALAGLDGVTVTGVRGHPGALLAGLVDGVSATVPNGRVYGGPLYSGPVTTGLSDVLGPDELDQVVQLSQSVATRLGHEVIEWATVDGRVLLLQSGRSDPAAVRSAEPVRLGPDAWCIGGEQAVPGDASGHLIPVRPEPGPAPERGILIADRPWSWVAPLLFGAAGLVCRSGPVDSHLAGVARAIGVPMLTGVAFDRAIGPVADLDDNHGWVGFLDGSRAELTLTRPPQEA